MFLLLITLLIVYLSTLRWQRRKKIRWCAHFKNDLFSLPVIGFAFKYFGDGKSKSKVFQAFGREAIKQGGLTSLHCWIADSFYTVVADAEVAELVLRKCLEKDDTMKVFDNFFPQTLATVPVSEWRPRRKTLNPSFANKNVNQYFQIFRKKSNVLVKTLQEKNSDNSFGVHGFMSAHSFDVLIETAFGVHSTPKNTINKALEALTVCSDVVSKRIVQPLLYNDFIYELTPMYRVLKSYSGYLRTFITENVNMMFEHFNMNMNNENENANEQCIGAQKSMLQNMVEWSTVPLSKKYVERETMVLVLAGSDTVSTALSFTCLLLGKYPDVQDKIYNELREVLGDSERTLEIEDLPKLKYTDAVLKESMRLYPPALLLLRKVDEDLLLPSGQILIKDTGVIINTWAVHRNPKHWGEDAEQFRPERFFDAPPKHPAAFLPFSYGPRNCIGYQYAMTSMKTCLATLVRQLRFLPAVDQDIGKVPKYENMETTFDIMMRDAANFHVRVQARH